MWASAGSREVKAGLRAGVGKGNWRDMGESFVLFADGRANGGAGRLYRAPRGEIVAHRIEEVQPKLDELRAAVRGGRHAAGFLAYEAGAALDPGLKDAARSTGGPLLWFGLFDGYETPGPLPDAGSAVVGDPRPRITREAYLAAATEVREGLFAGDFYQANLTFGCDVAVGGSPLGLFARLQDGSRAGWGGVLQCPEATLVSLSPEQFFTLRDGLLEARPMKGTERRHADPASDAAAAERLAADPKQRAENLMIVDLLRNDLARVAETGSVAVPRLFEVETYPTVHQLVSVVTATLRKGLDAVDVIRTIFPCGSVTGAPKVAAMLALRRLEPEPRGAYTGSMGWIEPHGDGAPGDAAFNVLIRTLELSRPGSGTARLGLGSGLVVDGELEQEWAECLLKGAFVSQATPRFDLIETMRFDPEQGLEELDRHFERMRSSAEALGFAFDRHAARNELQAATFRRREPAMVRLLLSPSGATAIEVKRLARAPNGPVSVTLQPMPVEADDIRLCFKTSDRAFYDDARVENATFETIFVDRQGRLTEGSFTNIFVRRGGRLLTPPLDYGLMPGILRAKLIEEGVAVEAKLVPEDLMHGFFIGNIVRGLMAARLV